MMYRSIESSQGGPSPSKRIEIKKQGYKPAGKQMPKHHSPPRAPTKLGSHATKMHNNVFDAEYKSKSIP